MPFKNPNFWASHPNVSLENQIIILTSKCDSRKFNFWSFASGLSLRIITLSSPSRTRQKIRGLGPLCLWKSSDSRALTPQFWHFIRSMGDMFNGWYTKEGVFIVKIHMNLSFDQSFMFEWKRYRLVPHRKIRIDPNILLEFIYWSWVRGWFF